MNLWPSESGTFTVGCVGCFSTMAAVPACRLGAHAKGITFATFDCKR